MTHVPSLVSLEVDLPKRNDFLHTFFEECGSQLTGLKTFQYTNPKDTHLHSVQPLLPRKELLDSIRFSMADAKFKVDETSQRKNMYDKVKLSEVLDMQYTKCSKFTVLKFRELSLDIKVTGFDPTLVTQETLDENQNIEAMYEILEFEDYKCV